MATIRISEPHNLPFEEVKKRIAHLTEGLHREYDVRCEWQGPSTILVKRTGLSGQIRIHDKHIDISLELGFLLNALKNKIEARVITQLRQAMTGPDIKHFS